MIGVDFVLVYVTGSILGLWLFLSLYKLYFN